MKPRRTPESNTCLELPGGNEDNYLWAQRIICDDGAPAIVSVWEPSPREREAITRGARIELVVLGTRHPAVAMRVEKE